MANASSNRTIADQMRSSVRKASNKGAQPAPTCGAGFTVDDFAVTYPNEELIANAAVTDVPSGVTLLGVTVAATSGAGDTYCMAVAYDSAGLSLPVSVLAASTSPAFSSPTQVTGVVILNYTQNGASQQCSISKPFTVGE